MNLKDVKRVLKETTIENYNKTEVRLTPIQKFEVLYHTVQKLYEDGQITKAQFLRWTTVY